MDLRESRGKRSSGRKVIEEFPREEDKGRGSSGRRFSQEVHRKKMVGGSLGKLTVCVYVCVCVAATSP